MTVRDLVRFIVWYSNQSDILLTTNKLVKFLYLADLYYARYNKGAALTGLPWRFVYYGPYCPEAMSAIDETVSEGLISMSIHEGRYDKDFRSFTCRDPEAEQSEQVLPLEVVSQLKWAIKTYGDDTPSLLDYVYFETEPMEDVKKGDLLDFSKARVPIRSKAPEPKKLSKEQIRLARQYISQLADSFEKGRKRLLEDEKEASKWKDDEYYQMIDTMDGDDLTADISGIARIK